MELDGDVEEGADWRGARGAQLKSSGGRAEGSKDSVDYFRLGDASYKPHAAVALGTFEYINIECSAHQGRPCRVGPRGNRRVGQRCRIALGLRLRLESSEDVEIGLLGNGSSGLRSRLSTIRYHCLAELGVGSQHPAVDDQVFIGPWYQSGETFE